MSFKIREEIVGKRFLSVSGLAKLKAKMSDWCWRAGVVRAATHKDINHKELQLLVEYDDMEWSRREWVQPHKSTFQFFLVEKTLVWAPRAESPRSIISSQAPAITFTEIVGELPSHLEAVEFIRDRHIAFRDPANFKNIQEVERRWREDSGVREWIRTQDGQGILLTTPSILVGYRVQVYRVEGTTQWYTAVIVGYNPSNGELTVTDDTVLEDHNVDPCLVQMRLIGDGVIESIMKGENVGITPRRSRSSLVLSHRPTVRPKREGKRRKVPAKKEKGGGAGKPPPRPPDRGKSPPTPEAAESPPPSPVPPEKESSLTPRQSPSPVTKEPQPEPDPEQEPANGRSLRSLRIRSTEKTEAAAKARPAPRVKKKGRKEKSSPKESEEEEDGEVENGSRTPPQASPVPSPLRTSESSSPPAREETAAENSPVSRLSPLPAVPGSPPLSPPVSTAPAESPPPPPVSDEPRTPSPPPVCLARVEPPPAECLQPASQFQPPPPSREEQEEGGSSDAEERVKAQEEAGSSPNIDDDDGPIPLSSPFRMEDSSGGSVVRDDRSDSGVSSLRSAGSGDERSGSRSSALSPTPPPLTARKIAESWRDSGGGMSGPPGYPAPGLLIPPPPTIYSNLPPELWSTKPPPPPPRYPPPSPADLYHERIMRERREQEAAQKEKEKQERERERLEREQRERAEKQRAAEQAVHKHFEESLRLAQQKSRNNMCWINSLPGPPRTEEKHHQQQQQQQQQHQQAQQQHAQALAAAAAQQHQVAQQQAQQHQAAAAAAAAAAQQQHHQQAAALERMRERAYYHRVKVDYPPPAHSRLKPQQPPEKPQAALPKAEPNFSLFGYPAPAAYQTPLSFLQQQHHEKKPEPKPALIVTKAVEDPIKNTVIVKNDKSPGLHPPSPKLREYLPPKSPYEYRSPSQSPHPGYEVQNLASISKVHVHRPQHLSPHQRQSPHSHHRTSQSPHHRQSPHHPPSPHLHPSPPTMAAYTSKPATVGSYPYPSPAVLYAPPTTPPKPKVSSPSPQVYQHQQPPPKPRPLSRGSEVPKPLTPSPYQQVAQHNLPPPAQGPSSGGLPPPPAAHAISKSYGLAVKQPPASPPGPGVAITPSFQTQPLDLGVARESSSPKRKSESPQPEAKKQKTEEEPVVNRTTTVTVTTVVSEPPRNESSPLPTVMTVTPSPQGRESPRPVHKLKKAWLQRHSGEDVTTAGDDIKGGGTCVTLPMPVSTAPPTPVVQPSVSLHSIGSMAVNSIKKPKQSRKPKELNGHVSTKSPEGDDSSSSDPERKSTPQKRVPPKVKRKKGGRKPVPEETKRKKTSVSSTDSEKESGSDKESDTNSTAGSTVGKKKEEKKESVAGKKRGRRPKSTPSKNGNEDESRKTKASEESLAPQRDYIQKPSVGQLKKTGESFLQDGPCFEVSPKLAKCRECRWTPNQRNRNMPNIFCRFYAFRRLRYTKNGQLAIAGFSDPHRDALTEDLKLWLPGSPPAGLDIEMSRFLLAQLGDQFCDLLQQEKEAVSIHMSDDKTIAWKRVVQGVREMCDVCETTLFNFHWACGKCGFVVCIDCYKGRKNGTTKTWGDPGRDRDDLSWLLCTNRQPHEQEKLMLTQIIAGDSLAQIGKKIHEARASWGIPQRCTCGENINGLVKKCKEMNGLIEIKKEDESNSPLSWLADVALSEDKKSGSNEDLSSLKGDDDDKESYSTLRELLIRPSGKSNGSRSSSPVVLRNPSKRPPSTQLDTLDQVINTVIEASVPKEEGCSELKHFVRKFRPVSGPECLPARVMTLTESKALYPGVPHSWLCEGRLLRLHDSKIEENYTIFQDQWKRGQPVLISDLTKELDNELWTPESFNRDFGDTKNDLVDCQSGSTVSSQPMRKFWEGFSSISKRLKDDRGQPMILKLKDWPPGEDFAEMLPSRFSDLMKALPMGDYTQRGGRLNLASRLPDCFVRPDLGPKMYTAYGTPSGGTTNLHLDISDAVNVMVYVGIPSDADPETYTKDVLKAIDEAGCDLLTKRRVREKGMLPGALWHIYMARDADKIRDLLNKVALERGTRLEPHHDPIHDQSWYLDNELRDRLYDEYGVEGYTIVQCLGDAVFIPAGAPHQVRNLHNCIKVAEDFVSPENVSHCFRLTQEFRQLSDTHTNHEDKLQIKNIMYHAVKDSLAVLAEAEGESQNEIKAEPEVKRERSRSPSAGNGST